MSKPISTNFTKVFLSLILGFLAFSGTAFASFSSPDEVVCEIFDMTAIPTDCNGDGQFFVVIDFEVLDPLSNTFSVLGNGNDYGDFPYADLPIELGPFQGDNGLAWEFVVMDNDSPNCSDFVEVGLVNCGNTACDVDNVYFEPLNASADGTLFLVGYDASGPPPITLGFDLIYNGVDIGFYPFLQLPAEVFIPCSLGSAGVITICDNDTNCCRDIEIELAGCENANCDLFDLVIEPLPCTPNGVFFVEITFGYENVGDNGFTVVGNGNNYGSFTYDQLPITVGPLTGDGDTVYEFAIIDNDNPDCVEAGAIDPVNCPIGDCEIWDLVAEPVSFSNDGTLFIIDFEHAGTSNVGFDVFYNDHFIGFYSYDDLPIEQFIGCNLGTPGVLTVCDNVNLDCCASIDIELAGCQNNCEIWDLIAEPYECDADGNFLIDIDFNYANTSNVFKVFVNGELYESYGYDDLFITIGPFPGDGNVYLIEVFDAEFPDCGAETEIEAPNCNVGNCEIWDLIAEAYECDADGNFLIDVDFNYAHTSNVFKVYVNGELYESYGYDDLFVTIGPFPGDGSVYIIEVFDAEFPDCGAITEIESPDCNNTGVCEIWDLVVEPYECENGEFLVDLDFNYANVGNQGFKVKIGSEVFSSLDYANLPVTLGPFAEGSDYAVLVRDVEDPSCSASTVLEAVECPSNCSIFDIVTEADCDDNGNYLLVVDFSYQDVGPLGFSVKYNGVSQGNFNYADLPIVIGPFPADGTPGELRIRDLEDGSCKIIAEVPPVLCTDVCTIFNLTAEAECNDDDNYDITIDFDVVNPGNDFFEVFTTNGVSLGFYAIDDLPVVLENVQNPAGSDVLVLIVCINDIPDCCEEITIILPDCNAPPCEIFDMDITAIDCVNNDEFFAVLDFQYDNVGALGFEVNVNGTVFGPFDYADLPVVLGPIANNGGPNTYIVRDLETPTCKGLLTTDPVDCGGQNCDITDFVLDPGACNSDGTYELFLNFNYTGATSDVFDVIYEGDIIATFPLTDLPVVIEEFPAANDPVVVVTVCIPNTFECCASQEYEAPDCPGLNPVWPGDANNNNTANNFDVLNLGVAFGSTGPERMIMSTTWQAFDAEDWTNSFDDSQANYKHADCDGNGVVNYDDLQAIESNYDETNGPVIPESQDAGDFTDVPLYVDLPDPGDIVFGEPFTAPVTLGSADIPANEFYGLAFSIEFDPTLIDANSVSLQFNPSWVGIPGQDVMVFHKVFASQGLIEAAIVRTDQNPVSGYGEIASFVGIIDDVLGRVEMEIVIQEVRAIHHDESTMPVQLPVEHIEIEGKKLELKSSTTQAINVYPNPAGEWISIGLPQGVTLEEWELLDARGQQLRLGTEFNNGKVQLMDVPSGIYWLRVQTDAGQIIERILKL